MDTVRFLCPLVADIVDDIKEFALRVVGRASIDGPEACAWLRLIFFRVFSFACRAISVPLFRHPIDFRGILWQVSARCRLRRHFSGCGRAALVLGAQRLP